jgi:hypothetical protein
VLSDQFFDQGPHFWLGRIHGWWTKLDWQNHIGISVYLAGKGASELGRYDRLKFRNL